MRKKGNVTKSEIFLLLLTAVFVITSLVFVIQHSLRRDTFSVTTQRRASVEETEETKQALPSPEPLDINEATAEELESLKGIGPVLAQRIVDYRTAHGAFHSVKELLEVKGIGLTKLNNFREMVTVKEEP